MNFDSSREDVEAYANSKICFYCNREFDNYQALHNHLRIHQNNRSLMGSNFHGRASNSIDLNRNPPIPLLNSEHNLAGANNPIPITRTPPPIDFCTVFHLNEANQADRNRSTGGNPRLPQTQIFMSHGVAVLCNSWDGRTFFPAGASASMASAIYVPSGSVVTTGLDTDSLPYLGSNGVCQFNTDEFQISQDGLPPTSRDDLKRTQGPPLFSSVEKVGQSERSLSTFGGNVHVELENRQLKELPLLDNFVESPSSAETGDGAEEEDCPADLNLSLHL